PLGGETAAVRSHCRQKYPRLQTRRRGGDPVQQVLGFCADLGYETKTAPLRGPEVARASDESTDHVSVRWRGYRAGPPALPEPTCRASIGLVSSGATRSCLSNCPARLSPRPDLMSHHQYPKEVRQEGNALSSAL